MEVISTALGTLVTGMIEGDMVGQQGVLRCMQNPVMLPHRDGPSFLPLANGTPEDVAAKYVSTRPIIQSISAKTFQLARGWLQKCTHEHAGCPKPTSDFMPTRLLLISEHSGQFRVRLVTSTDSEIQNRPYVTLSYCWGGAQSFTACKDNLDALTQGLSAGVLPQTLQDAIKTTHMLHFEYIWIDSLCIVQDDAQNMAREIAQMPMIYSQATVTIAATRAQSSIKGFLQDRITPKDIRANCRLPFRDIEGRLGSVVALTLHPKIDYLDTRAWTLQEMFLSPRILAFGHHQVSWMCARPKASKAIRTAGGKSPSNQQTY